VIPFKRGLYSLSADPPHIGHRDVAEQAASQCDELIIAICNSMSKESQYMFDLKTRAKMAQRAFEGISNANIITTSRSIVTDIFLRENCDVLFRGIRDENDKKSELSAMEIHEIVLPGISDKTVFIDAKPEHRLISSTLIKGFVAKNVPVVKYVGVDANELLQRKVNDRIYLGLYGDDTETFMNMLISAYPHNVFAMTPTGLLKSLINENSHAGRTIKNIFDTCEKCDIYSMPDVVLQMERKFREILTRHSAKIVLLVGEWILSRMDIVSNNVVIVGDSSESESILENIFQKIQRDRWGRVFRFTSKDDFDVIKADLDRRLT